MKHTESYWRWVKELHGVQEPQDTPDSQHVFLILFLESCKYSPKQIKTIIIIISRSSNSVNSIRRGALYCQVKTLQRENPYSQLNPYEQALW